MAKAAKKKYLFDGPHNGRYVRAFNEGRQEIAVQVWSGLKPEGEPEGDWLMPKIIGLVGCIDQAILNTDNDRKK